MKIIATMAAVATLAAVSPAFADGDNPVTNAVKDRQMMATGRYELPFARSYDRATRPSRYNSYSGDGYAYGEPVRGYGYYDGYAAAPQRVYRAYPGDMYYGGGMYPSYGYID